MFKKVNESVFVLFIFIQLYEILSEYRDWNKKYVISRNSFASYNFSAFFHLQTGGKKSEFFFVILCDSFPLWFVSFILAYSPASNTHCLREILLIYFFAYTCKKYPVSSSDSASYPNAGTKLDFVLHWHSSTWIYRMNPYLYIYVYMQQLGNKKT